MAAFLSRLWASRVTKWAAILATLSILPAWVLSLASDPMEVGRLRNALVAEVGQPSDFTWLPANRPKDFLLDKAKPSQQAEQVVRTVLGGMDEAGGFEKALALARFLLSHPSKGGEIKSDFDRTLEVIATEDRGYCADFTQVMVGLLNAAGLPVRRWGFSFDGYGGHGHAFVEVFDQQHGWVFMDVFNGFYVRDAAGGRPLSVLEFRQRILDGKHAFAIERIKPDYIGFVHEEKLLDYFSQGAHQYFLVWGRNLFEYEGNPLVKAGHKFSRSLEQLAGIVTGTYPKMKIMPFPESRREIDSLIRLKWELYAALAGEALIGLAWLRHLLKSRRQKAGAGEVNQTSWCRSA